jgi:anti-sigma factor RsiW
LCEKEAVMKCNELRELMPDLAAGLSAAAPEMKAHLDSCSECAAKLEALRQTMALLDEWQAPEPSPYFDVRLRARLREEAARQPAGWLQWLRRPALAVALAVLMVASVTLLRVTNHVTNNGGGVSQGPVVQVQAGTAVGDLQALEKNHELYADFDILDDLEVQSDVTANP